MQNDIVLSLRGISKAFPGVKALQNVDFTLRKGEIRALMGENGGFRCGYFGSNGHGEKRNGKNIRLCKACVVRI